MNDLGTKFAEKLVEYKDALAQALAEAQKLRQLVDLCPIPMVTFSITGEKTYANAAYLEFVGADNISEVLGDAWQQFFPVEDRPDVASTWSHVIHDQLPVYEGHRIYRRKDGTMLDGYVRVCRVMDYSYGGFVIPGQCYACFFSPNGPLAPNKKIQTDGSKPRAA